MDAAQGTERTSSSPSRLAALLQGPHAVRSAALTGTFVLLLGFTLHVARGLIVPVVVAAFLNVLFTPFIRRLRAHGIPEKVGAALVLGAGLVPLLLTGYLLAEPASEWGQRLPMLVGRLEQLLRPFRKPVEEVTRATEHVEKLAQMGAPDGAQPVALREPSLLERILDEAGDVLTEAGIMLVLLYFLLASPEVFLRKVVRLMPRREDAERAVAVLRKIELQIGRYLQMLSIINVVFGVAVGLAMWILGMPNPALWGVMAAVLRFIPYVGTVVSVVVLTGVAVVSTGEIGRIVAVPVVYLGLGALEGNFISPYLVGRHLNISPVILLLAVIFWGWMWGIAGALLAVPMLVAVKAVCENVPSLEPIGDILGHLPSPSPSPSPSPDVGVAPVSSVPKHSPA